MGFTPDQVGQMSLFQYACCVDGVNKANAPEDRIEPPTDEEFEAAMALHGIEVSPHGE
jgi:hypothetical protein